MGQAETKIFENAPAWHESDVLATTDFEEEMIDVCWKIWAQDSHVHHSKLREEGFYELLGISEENVEERAQANHLFELLDRDDDQKISKREMVETLDLLGLHQMEHDEKGKVKISDKVENLFSLMDFAQDGKICEAEFLRTTMHYRNLGKYLTIDLLESSRKQCLAKISKMHEALKVEKEEKLLKNQKSKDKKSVDKNPTADQVTDQLEMVAKELEDVKALEEMEEEEEVNNESDK